MILNSSQVYGLSIDLYLISSLFSQQADGKWQESSKDWNWDVIVHCAAPPGDNVTDFLILSDPV